MKKILFILLLIITSQGAEATRRLITSLPYTWSAGDTPSPTEIDSIWISGNDLGGTYNGIIDTIVVTATDTIFDTSWTVSTTGAAFSFGTVGGNVCDDIYLDIHNDSIIVNTAGTNNLTALNIGNSNQSQYNNVHDVVIRCGFSWDGVTATDTVWGGIHFYNDPDVLGAIGINIGFSYNITILDPTVTLYGKSFITQCWNCTDGNPDNDTTITSDGTRWACAIQLGGTYQFNQQLLGTTPNRTSNGRINNFVTDYFDRCLYAGATIRAQDWRHEDYDQEPTYLYDMRIDGINIQQSPHIGIIAQSRGGYHTLSLIDSCYISVDTRTDTVWNSVFDGSRVAANGCFGSANGYAILTGGFGEGSRITFNTLRSGESYYGGRGIMLEGCGENTPPVSVTIYGNDVDVHEGDDPHYVVPLHALRKRYGDMNDGYVLIDSNTFIARGNTTGQAYTGRVICFRYSDAQPSNDSITRNTFQVITDAGSTEGVAVMFDNNAAIDLTTLYWQYNHVESDRVLFKLGDYNSSVNDDVTNFVIIEDTLVFSSPNYSPVAFSLGYTSTALQATMTERNSVYQGGADTSDVLFSANATNLRQIDFQETLELEVTNNSSEPIPGVAVTVTNGTSSVVASGTTNGSGIFTANLTYLTQTKTATETWTSYNNFTINVVYSTFDEDHIYTFSYDTDGNKIIQLDIGAVPDATFRFRRKRANQ